MTQYKIYVDGQSGTTGLQIHERLMQYPEIDMLTIDPQMRRDPAERQKLLNAADLVFLCLPDDAARESVALLDNPNTRVIDASTAHRTAADWVYGLPELAPGQREAIKHAKKVAVTGCHASATILGMKPLRASGLLPADYPVVIHSLTGYSGGGKRMIETYEVQQPAQVKSPRPYALGLQHKHLPEVTHYLGLAAPPVFIPIVADYYKGLVVTLPLHSRLLGGISRQQVHQTINDYYAGEYFINVLPLDADVGVEAGYFDVQSCNDTNRADIAVVGNDDQVLVMVRLDNLAKGASGAAIQCMNLMLGFDENHTLAKYQQEPALAAVI